MKKFPFFLTLSILCFVLNGCVPTKPQLRPEVMGDSFVEVKAPSNGSGNVYIFRPLFSVFLSKELVTVSLEKADPIALPFGGFTHNNLPAGKYSLSLSPYQGASKLWNKEHKIEVKPGENTYVAVWATEDVSQHLQMMVLSSAVIAPVVDHELTGQAVLIEAVSEEMALPVISECVHVE